MPKRHFGCIIDHADTDRLLGELRHPLFGAAAPDLDDTGDNKLSLIYLSVIKYAGKNVYAEEAQTTGDCTSKGTNNGADGSRAVEIHIRNEPEVWLARSASEVTYGARQHGGQGMSPSVASRFLNEHGIVARAKYGKIDLRKYDSSKGTNWGRRGIPKSILKVADLCLNWIMVRIMITWCVLNAVEYSSFWISKSRIDKNKWRQITVS